ncbi:MAG: hypothetical protein IT410_02350 [Candidatus Doudnabacteria bacterium]|nr:hypothetical protein [Candidatus Doudnabacteria bacterium]
MFLDDNDGAMPHDDAAQAPAAMPTDAPATTMPAGEEMPASTEAPTEAPAEETPAA